MSKLSELCQYYIKQSHTNVYQIAKNTSLDRTMLQKMVKGTKLPGKEFFETFLDCLFINENEREELLYEYHIEKIGRALYNRRLAIEKMFKRYTKYLNDYKHNDLGAFNSMTDIDKHFIEVQSKNKLKQVLHSMTVYEMEHYDEPVFHFNTFPENIYVKRALLELTKDTDTKGKCYEYLHMFRDEYHDYAMETNVENFSYILPFSFMYKGNYELSYAYVSHDKDDYHYLPWPYYVITHEHLFMIDITKSKGMLIHDKEAAKSAMQMIQSMKVNYMTLFKTDQTIRQQVDNFIDFTKDRRWMMTFQNEPTLTPLVERTSYEPEEGYSLYTYLVKCLKEHAFVYDENYISINGERGLKGIIETGIIPDFYGEGAPVFSVEDRLKMLDGYLDLINIGYTYILKNEYPLMGLQIDLFSRNGIAITSTSKDMPFMFLIIEEPVIYKTLEDYFKSLIDEGMVYSIEESKKKTKEFVEKYKKVLSEMR